MALWTLSPFLKNQAVMHRMDNKTEVAYVQKQGGTHSFQSFNRGDSHLSLGRAESAPALSNLHPRVGECRGGSPISSLLVEQRVGYSPGRFQAHMPEMGETTSRSFCHPNEHKASSVPGVIQVSAGFGNGCPHLPMEFPVGILIPAYTPSSWVPPDTAVREGNHHCDPSLLSQKTMVHPSPSSVNGSAHGSSFMVGSSIPGGGPSTQSGQAEPQSLEVERRRLQELGCTSATIATMLSSRKRTTEATYSRIWEKFVSFASAHLFNALQPDLVDILNFSVFLVAITLAKRVSELQALGSEAPHIQFFCGQSGSTSYVVVYSKGSFQLPLSSGMVSPCFR